jgi:alkanesulfonate monooxygenase SsuD/methylene tetrahydromethanopterin reductase-like flavin-dependent oxidoreductase (luciferase family)
MRLGLALGVARLPLGESARLAGRAEAAGFDLVCAGEAAYDSFASATLLATATRKAGVMTAVSTWARSPVLASTAAATVDAVSGGRFTLGLGTMPAAWSRDFHGVDPDRPLARMREYVDVVRGALAAHSGRTLDADGEFYPVRGWSRWEPPPREDLPVHLAATRPGMARLAGEVADGVLANVVHTRRWLAEVLVPAVAAGEERRGDGRRVVRGVMVRCLVHGSGERPWALDALRPSLALYQPVPYFTAVVEHAGLSPADLSDDLVRAMCVVGTADEVAEQLGAYAGLVDWVELTPPSGLDAAALRDAYAGLLALPALLAGRAD